MSVEDIAAAKAAPHGYAAEIIRRYDPAWGLKGHKTFKVTVVRKVIEYHTAEVVIAAQSAKDAKTLTDMMPKKDFDFKYDDEEEEIEVEDVTEQTI